MRWARWPIGSSVSPAPFQPLLRVPRSTAPPPEPPPPPGARGTGGNRGGPPARARRAAGGRGGPAPAPSLPHNRPRPRAFLFFRGASGRGPPAPPRLVKADQLELEVYWRAPASSKQRVIGWRDQAQLPTDINYHRDHLGIIQNNFGAARRLGEGDEVRAVPPPLSRPGPVSYDFAL